MCALCCCCRTARGTGWTWHPLSAGRRDRRGRHGGSALELGAQSLGRSRRRYVCLAQAAVHCRCAPAAAGRRHGIDRDTPGPLLTPDERRLLDALADQAAVAIERISLARGLAKRASSPKPSDLRAALLTSISHDLRTPLASIIAQCRACAAIRTNTMQPEPRNCWGRCRMRPSGSTASSQFVGHDPS